MINPKPTWVFNLWASGCGDDICAIDSDLPLTKFKRFWWRVRGMALMMLFGWWWWEYTKRD